MVTAEFKARAVSHSAAAIRLLPAVYGVYLFGVTWIERNQLHPATRFGWSAEQFTIAGCYVVFGGLLFLSRRGKTQPLRFSGIVSVLSLLLSVFSVLAFLRYFNHAFALLALVGTFALVKEVYTYPAEHALLRRCALAVSVMGVGALFLLFGASYLSVKG